MTTSTVTARRKGDPQHYVEGKKEPKPRNPYFYKLQHGFWIIVVVKPMVFHTFDYKNNVLAYKSKGFVVLVGFLLGHLSDPGRRLDEPGCRPRWPIIPRPPDGQKVVLKKKTRNLYFYKLKHGLCTQKYETFLVSQQL